MIRLVLLLCGGLYLAFMVLGQDHGQKRYGLMLADTQPVAAQPVASAAKQAVFIPAQTVMAPTPAPVVTEAAPDTAALPDPEIPGGKLLTVLAKQVNVREGPGKGFGVLGSLTKGEQVLVVTEDAPTEGWSKVRLEGDGIEGYVATRLLTE